MYYYFISLQTFNKTEFDSSDPANMTRSSSDGVFE